MNRNIDLKRELWDIEETYNFVPFIRKGKQYLVYNKHSKKSQSNAADMLCSIDQFIHEIQQKAKYSKNPKAQLLGYLNHTVQEMNIDHNLGFDGINKPKELIFLDKPYPIYFKKDNGIRPSYRHIMFTIRRKTNDGELRKFKPIKDLILHELAHTMCNHCLYRDSGNHEEDFDECEKYLKQISENIPFPRK